MDIRQLKYYQAIVTEGTISKAAKRLFITQPSLTQQLQLLENSLGVKLIERGKRQITLTEAGRLLHDRADHILQLIQTTTTELKQLHEGYRGTLSIGSIASSGVTLLPSLIRDFHKQYPDIKFQLWEGDTHKILDLLNNGLIEIGIVRSAIDLAPYHSKAFTPEPMIAAMSPAWINNRNVSSISILELANKPLLIHRSNETLIVNSCLRFGIEPQILCKGEDIRSLLVLASEGIGLAIVPKSALGLVPGNALFYQEISEDQLKIEKAVIWSRQKHLSAAGTRFLETIIGKHNLEGTN